MASYYPYSQDLASLLELGKHAKFHPIYAIGLTRDELHKLRNSYINPDSPLRIGIYGIYDPSILLTRVGIDPSVIILNKHIEIRGDIARFIKRSKVPVLRILDKRVNLVELPHSDYYGGVYEVIEYGSIFDTRTITYMIDLGILVYLRNHGERLAKSKKLDFSEYDSSVDVPNEPRKLSDTAALRRTMSRPPQKENFMAFATEELEKTKQLLPSSMFEQALLTNPLDLNTPTESDVTK